MNNFVKFTMATALMATSAIHAQNISITPAQKGHDVSPGLYGIFFEEINHAGEGGLYAELVRNRNFEEHVLPSGMTLKNGYAVAPHSFNYEHGGYRDWRIKWDTDSLKTDGWRLIGNAQWEVTSENQLDPATPHAMRLDMGETGTILENNGYWGMRIIGKEKYDLRFYVNPKNYTGEITAKIVSQKGKVLASHRFKASQQNKWQEFKTTLQAKATDYKASLQLEFSETGSVYVDYVSLFPQNTFKSRKNGMRPDIAQMIADLKPGFLRWPGGCIVEGATLENRVKWKETLGDPMKRHSEWVLWNYHSSWGFGYHEFLQFCEDIGAAGMFVANVGLSCSVRNGDWTEDYAPYLQDIIDAIDYATAPVSNPWGAKRAAAGHPEPFNLKYVELGNEQVGDHYAERYNYFYRILKAKYPQITFISTLQLSPSREKLEKADMIDPHWYVDADFFYGNDHLFDNMERGKYDIYIGEYAVITEANMNAALAEAAFLTGVERNSDLVKMASYAPLMENHNRKDWPTNLIWFDNEKVMGRASYYVQKMYAHNRPTYNVEVKTEEVARNLTQGNIGFLGNDLSEYIKNLTIKDAQGKTVNSDINLAALSRNEKKPRRPWERAIVTNILNNTVVNGGSVEFDMQLIEKEAPAPAFSIDQKPQKETIAPRFIFGAENTAPDDYFVLNLPQITNGRQMISMGRAKNNSADHNPGGGSLQMENNYWYHAKIVFGKKNEITVYIDGQKVFEQTASAPTGHYTIAGYDEQTGETIIKVVNATESAYTPNIHLNAQTVATEGEVITLSAQSKQDENTMDEPKRIIPQHNRFKGFGKDFSYTFKPNSFTILRVKTSKQ